MEIPFTKWHGIGNDIVIIDTRENSLAIDSAQAASIASRHYGVGCDQVMVITAPPANSPAQIGLRIFNNDGSPAGACGNGTRCVADYILADDDTATLTIAVENGGGMITAWRDGRNTIAVDMGAPKTGWQEIPCTHETDTLASDLGEASLPPAVLVNMGNPHAVHFVDDADAVDIAVIGARLTQNPLFTQGANIEFATLMPDGKIRMRVFERGAGETIACGSGACATLVAAVRRGLLHDNTRRGDIILDGGVLDIEWREDSNHVIMRGPSTFVFAGKIAL